MANSSNVPPTAATKISNGPFRSKLCAFASDIARWQRQGKSYRQIAALLLETHGVKVDHETIWSFVTVRERAARTKRRILPESYLNPPEAAAPATTLAASVNTACRPVGVINHALGGGSNAAHPPIADGENHIERGSEHAARDMHGRPVSANPPAKLADL